MNNTITVKEITYEVLSETIGEITGVNKGYRLLWLKRPAGKKLFTLVIYPNGTMSQVS